LYVFENLHDDILLLNILSEEDSIQLFLSTYDNINRNKADNFTQGFQTYIEYYLNRLGSLKNFQLYLDRIFQESCYNIVKVQRKFGVIWESQDVGNEIKFNYYSQPVHNGSAAKMPLLVINSKIKRICTTMH
jgi:hypothetical protein